MKAMTFPIKHFDFKMFKMVDPYGPERRPERYANIQNHIIIADIIRKRSISRTHIFDVEGRCETRYDIERPANAHVFGMESPMAIGIWKRKDENEAMALDRVRPLSRCAFIAINVIPVAMGRSRTVDHGSLGMTKPKLKNYTTKVPADKTASEISVMLARHGARRTMQEFDDVGGVVGIAWQQETPQGMISFKLPVNVEKCHLLLKRDLPRPRDEAAMYEHSRNVAWRLIKDWLSVQLDLLQHRTW